MKPLIAACLACAVVLPSLCSALEPPTPTILYVRCGKLTTSASAPLQGPTLIIVSDGRITAIGASLGIPEGAQQLDYSRYTVVPGFIDSHIHLWTGGHVLGTLPSYGLQTLRAQQAVAYALRSGIVGVRVLGTDGFIDVALADAVDEGTIPGPHILPADHPIPIPAGHSDSFTYPVNIPLDAFYTPLQGFINSPADADKALHYQTKYGAKAIKIMASGGIGSPLDSPTAEQLSPEEMTVIVEQAHMAHLKVSAHDEMITMVQFDATPKHALIAGTSDGAGLASWPDMGTLEVGKEAGFVALDGDPRLTWRRQEDPLRDLQG